MLEMTPSPVLTRYMPCFLSSEKFSIWCKVSLVNLLACGLLFQRGEFTVILNEPISFLSEDTADAVAVSIYLLGFFLAILPSQCFPSFRLCLFFKRYQALPLFRYYRCGSNCRHVAVAVLEWPLFHCKTKSYEISHA